jgi:Leucine-rich repeat (LRR) protein
VLDLSYNSLTTIDGLDGLAITELNLEGNNITSLSGVSGLPRLSILNVSKNRIRSLAPLSTNAQLYNLDIQDNDIVYLRQTEFLGAMRWLQILSLAGNPCCSKPHAR